jgi:outer membrane protein assembly factor BamB
MKRLLGGVLLLGLGFLLSAPAADWPMAGADAQRSGRTAEELPAALALRWSYQAPHAPMPAWPKSDRQPFDRVYHPVVAGSVLCFGSSADGKVYAIDAATGKDLWSFATGGPVRFAPAIWKDRLFAASDDGFLYCLSLTDGKRLWQKRGGPDERLVLGNDRLISQWPARGGPVVVDDVVYFGAGIWPSDGIYLYALDASTGKVLWCNDQSGSIYMGQPHGGANAHSGVAAQGYLVAAGDRLLVPTGRAVPAAFKRADGKFDYFHLQQYGHKGGTTTLATGSFFLNSGLLFDAPKGTLLEAVGPGPLAQLADGLVRSTEKEVIVMRFADKEKKDKKGELTKYRGLEKAWAVAGAPGGMAVAVAGKKIITASAKQMGIIDTTTKQLAWSTDVDGVPQALAVANGRLYVSTDKGTIHCFAAPSKDRPALIQAKMEPSPYGENAVFAAAAREIVEKTGISEGYCADLGCGDGALAYELARRTKLHIYAIESDPAKVALARKKLDAAGLHGVRVTVLQGDPAKFPFPRYFANLVVCGRSVGDGNPPPEAAVLRVQRPSGGVFCAGKPGTMGKMVRGPLAGTGNWTHQYADPANTSCSADTLVKGPLTMLWFRDSDFEMPQRHGRGPAPLYLDGRLFVEGLNAIRAVDAYNGRLLWEAPLPQVLRPFHGEHLMGSSGTGSNMCVTSDGVYVRTGSRCLRFDPATGKKLAEFEAPPLPSPSGGEGRVRGKAIWGYIAGEKGMLFGSLVNEEHVVKWRYGKGDMSEQFTESVALFALDAITGKLKWTQPARSSIRHNTVAIGGGKVFFIDRPTAEIDRITAEKDKLIEHRKGELVALDAATGKLLWKSNEDIFGTLLAVSAAHDALLMAYQPTAFRLPSEKGGQLAVFRASDGKPVWNQKAAYSTRPVINDRTIYAQGGSWDLLTGSEGKFDLKRSYGCGQLASSAHLLVYRSATLGYHDLLKPAATVNYGGLRPGCWINAIPAGGVVLVPDATAGCQCSYLNQAWIALQPRE